MTLVDTSSLVHFLRRKGDGAAKERVRRLLSAGQGAICEIVAVELWMGVRSKQDGRDMKELLELLPFLEINTAVWMMSRRLALKCREGGVPVPSSDIVIAACAFVHGASIESSDAHFARLEEIWPGA
ncbi:MAG: PIN domain-containing protein [Chthoniobacterales bacterium]